MNPISSLAARMALGALLFAGVLSSFAILAMAAPVTFVPRQDVWKWYAGPTDPGAGWQNPGFADGLWSSGTAPLGYGEAYVVPPVLPYGGNPNNKWVSYYFRKEFFVTGDPSGILSLKLGANYDDGIVVYINGAEVARRAIAPGPVVWGTFATDHESFNSYEVVDITATGKPQLIADAMNTIAVEIHQATPTSSDLVFDLEMIASATPSITRGPYLQNGAPFEMTVRWRTDLATPSRVRYGNTLHSLSAAADDTTMTTEHEVRLTGLTSHTRFYYSVGDFTETFAGDDDTTFFRTNPFPGDPYPTRVWVIGDAGRNSILQRQVRTAYETWTGDRHTDMWLMLGDNAYNTGTDLEYQNAVFNMYKGMLRKSCMWPTRGNHDNLHDGPLNDYYELFTMPTAGEGGGVPSGSEAYYSFDFGNIHFINLDTEGTTISVGGAMAVWLRQDLAANDKPWTVAFWHHPPYSEGSHISDNDLDSGGRLATARRVLVPILDSTGVDVVLCGHSHSYERSFLLNGHYGISSTLAPEMIIDGGAGRQGIDGAYVKPTMGSGPFEGAVYVVAGSSGFAGGGPLNHPVMIESLNLLGSLVLDIHGNKLLAHFVDSAGTALDSFTIYKGPGILETPETPVLATSLSLAMSSANPGTRGASFDFTLPRGGRAHLDIFDMAGRRMARVADRSFEAGRHRAQWNGRDSNGKPVPAGVYFAVIESGGERRATKVVIAR